MEQNVDEIKVESSPIKEEVDENQEITQEGSSNEKMNINSTEDNPEQKEEVKEFVITKDSVPQEEPLESVQEITVEKKIVESEPVEVTEKITNEENITMIPEAVEINKETVIIESPSNEKDILIEKSNNNEQIEITEKKRRKSY